MIEKRLGLSVGKCYRCVNNAAVRILNIQNETWGIYGEYLTGPKKGSTDTWDDFYTDGERIYPRSFDVDEYGLSLTTKEIKQKDYPEYFL